MSLIDSISDFMTGSRKKARGKLRGKKGKNCYCHAYPFPHSPGGGKCSGSLSHADGASSRKRKPRRKSRARKAKRTLKVCYCEKKYLAKDGTCNKCGDSARSHYHKRRPRGVSHRLPVIFISQLQNGMYQVEDDSGNGFHVRTLEEAKETKLWMQGFTTPGHGQGHRGRPPSSRRRRDVARSKKKWMQRVTKRSHRGALHRTLGIPQGQRIPYELKNAGCKNPRKTLRRVTGKTPTKKAASRFQKQACLARTYADRGGKKRRK